MATREDEIRRRIAEDLGATSDYGMMAQGGIGIPVREGATETLPSYDPGQLRSGDPITSPAAQPPAPVQQQPQQQITPVATAPPPPPPPPPAPGIGDAIEGYALDWMETPNRYLSDLVAATRQESDLRLRESERNAQNEIAEWASQRGLLGSSYEGEQNVALQEGLARARSEEERALIEMLANAEILDRRSAGDLGLGVAELEASRGLEGDRLALERERLAQQESEFSRELAQERSQFEESIGLSREELDLRAQELADEFALGGRQLDLQEARDIATREYQLGQLGISREDLTLRAEQIQQQALLEGRSLDIAEARLEAEQDLATRQMTHQLELQNNEIAQRENEFAREYGLNEREFYERSQQFAMQMAEQIAQRNQDNSQFVAALESEDARHAVEMGLRERALDLQGEGMDLDEAFRRAQLDQERDLTERAQFLTERGINLDDAYRYAALDQDQEFRQRALDLQEEGQNALDAYRNAELEYQERASIRRDESTRLAILVQTLNALSNIGGLGGDVGAILSMIQNLTGIAPRNDGGQGGEGGDGGDGGQGGDRDWEDLTDDERDEFSQWLNDRTGEEGPAWA